MRILLAIALLAFSLQAKSFFSNDQQVQSSKYIMALKDLIVSAQKTRGVTLSYINGNTSALLLIHNFRDDMKSAIGTMESLPLSHDAVINSRATSISTSFVKLNSKALKMSSTEAFDAYTENIAQTLMLAQTVSKTSAKTMNPYGQEISKIMMETILPLTEWMGELRALGSGAAARGTANEKQIVQMKVLVMKIQKLDQTLQAQMRSVVSKNKSYFGADINSRLIESHKAISKYVKFTKKEILKSTIAADSTDYFELATDSISPVVVIFNRNNDAILEDSKGMF